MESGNDSVEGIYHLFILKLSINCIEKFYRNSFYEGQFSDYDRSICIRREGWLDKA